MLKLIAHRAISSKFTPNTIEAINDSLSKPYIKGIEIDIRITKDKKFILNHDAIINLDNSKLGIINNLTLKQLIKYKKTPLKKVLKLKTDKIIIIEIKDNLKEELLDLFYNQIKKSKLNIYISSFHKNVIEYLKKYNLKLGIIVGYNINKSSLNKYSYNIVSYSNIDNVDLKKETFVWTINDVKKYKVLKKQYDNIYVITDNANKFGKMIEKDFDK